MEFATENNKNPFSAKQCNTQYIVVYYLGTVYIIHAESSKLMLQKKICTLSGYLKPKDRVLIENNS